MYDDELASDATRIMKDLSLFEVPSRDHFTPTATTPKRTDTSAGEEFEKKREIYANLNFSSKSYPDFALANEHEYGRILSRAANAASSSSSYAAADVLGSPKRYVPSCKRPLGAIESLIISGQAPDTKDVPLYAKIDRASVIAASKFATPKTPSPADSQDSKHSSPRASVAHCDPPPYPHSKPPPDYPIYANLQELQSAVSPASGYLPGQDSGPHLPPPPSVLSSQHAGNGLIKPSAQKAYGPRPPYGAGFEPAASPMPHASPSAYGAALRYSAATNSLSCSYPIDKQAGPQVYQMNSRPYDAAAALPQKPQVACPQVPSGVCSPGAEQHKGLPPPPPYPGYKPNAKTLLPYNVTPPRPKGPTEAEKKIEALMKQIEDELEHNPPEGEFFGESSCGALGGGRLTCARRRHATRSC
ncbi:conserved hypothetical protein [Ixodes scapularis]|uniref:Uncharacterized protein n=1 Tax=Ixodes scapularis TaxID=6945 RepID=B7PVE9_IXOSC|nr:conserved hypothetical protein [Ixodes scapularis]|eukprot:XP_002407901.1 conserved hypothetical protein [Ixodes scapularis]